MMLSGNNGILNRASEAKIETRGGEVQQERDMWKLTQTTDKYTTTKVPENLDELLERIGPNNQKLLTAEEVEEVKATGQVTIGSRTIVFDEVLTIGSEYDKGNIKIGDKLTYSANGQTDWIVFGKDESGNVLLASETPVGSYEPTYDVQHWLTWEDDLDAECDDYGTTLQGKTIKARSIRIEDINRVVGFTEPEFKTYKFTTDAEGNGQFANGKVKYYYPSLDAAGNAYPYFQKATVTTMTATGIDIPAKEFDFNAYSYRNDLSSNKYKFVWYPNGNERTDEIDLNTNLLKVDNMKYAVGEVSSYMNPYFIASRSVRFANNGAAFGISYVDRGIVNCDNTCMGSSGATGGFSGGGPSGYKLRPIAVLPPDIQVEKVTTEKFDIKK